MHINLGKIIDNTTVSLKCEVKLCVSNQILSYASVAIKSYVKEQLKTIETGKCFDQTSRTLGISSLISAECSTF
jgi:hypothetical protein